MERHLARALRGKISPVTMFSGVSHMVLFDMSPTCDNPSDRPPSGGEEEDVKADEGDEDFARGLAVGIRCAGDGDDVLANEHAHGAPEEHGTAAPLFDHVEAGHGAVKGVSGCWRVRWRMGREWEEGITCLETLTTSVMTVMMKGLEMPELVKKDVP